MYTAIFMILAINIFRSTTEVAGFDVHDIGTEQPKCAFVDKVKEVRPDIVGMSGVVILALDAMIQYNLKETEIRDGVKISQL
ncbi:MAG: hypothetical protein ACOWWH_07380 [Eubacteriaceae bacterium]